MGEYIYDGSFYGLITTIARILDKDDSPTSIHAVEIQTLDMFSEPIRIETVEFIAEELLFQIRNEISELAYNHVVAERGDDAELIVAASSATTTRLAQNAYAGMTADQVRFVGAIGADPGVIVVAADSPYQSLDDLVDAIKADPGSVAFAGGSAVGGFDHMKPLMVLQKAGFTDITAVKYIGVDGGADAITQTVGGFTQAMTGDMSEVVSFLANGDIRVIAVLTDERVPGFDDIPTAKEQGFDVVAVNWRGLYVPKGISDEKFDEWAGKLQQVADSPEWAQAMKDNGLAPFTKVGGDFQSYVDGLVADIATMSKELGVTQ